MCQEDRWEGPPSTDGAGRGRGRVRGRELGRRARPDRKQCKAAQAFPLVQWQQAG